MFTFVQFGQEMIALRFRACLNIFVLSENEAVLDMLLGTVVTCGNSNKFDAFVNLKNHLL